MVGKDRGLEVQSTPRNFPQIGQEYVVLAVLTAAYSDGKLPVELLILDSDRDPSWVSAACFSVVTGSIPSTWRAKIRENGMLKLGPDAWLEDGFWARYYGDDVAAARTAREVFRREAAVIEAEDSA
jgi:hypothetical protein